jgi:hypothetical protein
MSFYPCGPIYQRGPVGPTGPPGPSYEIINTDSSTQQSPVSTIESKTIGWYTTNAVPWLAVSSDNFLVKENGTYTFNGTFYSSNNPFTGGALGTAAVVNITLWDDTNNIIRGAVTITIIAGQLFGNTLSITFQGDRDTVYSIRAKCDFGTCYMKGFYKIFRYNSLISNLYYMPLVGYGSY